VNRRSTGAMNKSRLARTLRMMGVKSPRYARALFALLNRGRLGLSREQLDRIAGASNSPELVRQLKTRFGIAITTEMVYGRDGDGLPVKFGVYTLSDGARQQLCEFVLRQR
jgi:hypothetical protein